jgi:hypothetical protein
MPPLTVPHIHLNPLAVAPIIRILPRAKDGNLEVGKVIEYCNIGDSENCAKAIALIFVLISAGIVAISVPWLCVSGRCRRMCLSWENCARLTAGIPDELRVYRHVDAVETQKYLPSTLTSAPSTGSSTIVPPTTHPVFLPPVVKLPPLAVPDLAYSRPATAVADGAE